MASSIPNSSLASQPEPLRPVAQSAASLWDSDERWNLLMEHIKEYAIFMMDPEGRVVSWNKGAERVLGYTESDVLGQRLDRIFTPEDVAADVPRKELRTALEKGRAEDDRWQLRKDGTRFWANGAVEPLRTQDGRLKGYAKILRDRTLEKQLAEEREQARVQERDACAEAERQRDFVRAILDQAPFAVAVTEGPEHRYTYVNPAAMRLGNDNPPPDDTVLGKTLAELLPQVHDQLAPLLDRVYDTGVPVTIPMFRLPISGGREIFLQVTFAPLPRNTGEPPGVIHLAVDLTERRHAEDRLRHLAGELQQQTHLLDLAHVLVRDMDNRIVFWNRGAQALYGWSRAEALGKISHELLQTEFPRSPQSIEAELRAKGEWEGELIHTRKDGSRLTVASHWAVHVDENGKPAAILEVNNDTTELRKIREALREADRRKDEFLAVLGHELRNPLAPIHNAVQVLGIRGNDPVTVHWASGIISRQVRLLSRLVDDLLDVSRIARAKIRLDKYRTDLVRVVRETLQDHRRSLEDAGLRLESELPDDSLWVEGDGTRLAQILGNLLNNARKFTESGGAVTVKLRRDVARQEAVLSVRDTGIGIEPSALSRIFDPFTQAERTLARSQTGLGLGLALVKGLTEAHGGRVEAKSDGPNSGAEFTVYLPLLSG